MWWLFIVLLVAWLVLAWIIPFFFWPYVRKQPLPTRFPRELEDAYEQLSELHSTPYEYIHHASEYLLSQNSASRLRGVFLFRQAFETDAKRLLARSGFLHTHHLIYLMRVLLSKSSFFSDAEIRIRYVFLNFRLHYYLQVKVAGQWFDVDVAGLCWGVPLGSHAWGFR